VDKDELVREIERRYLPALHSEEINISAAFPAVKAEVRSQAYGDRSDPAGYTIALAGFFPGAPTDQSDEVTLELSFAGIWGPKPLLEAAVFWGHPGGEVEVNLFQGEVPMSHDALTRLDAELPRLLQVFRDAVRRGRPPTRPQCSRTNQ